jgi:DNA replication protein DnaC
MKIPSFGDMDQSEEDKKKLLEYSLNGKGFLILSGTNGSGKSYAAEAIYYQHTTYILPSYDNDEAIFVNADDLRIEWMANYEQPLAILLKYKNTKFLVLDDLAAGKSTPTESFQGLLYSIIDYRWRYRESKKTVITTNKNSNHFREIFGDALLSRIASGIIIRWDHKDRRHHEF